MLKELTLLLDRTRSQGLSIKRDNTNLRYYTSEKRTYPQHKELIQFIFEHSHLWEDDIDAYEMAYLQASYLIPEEKLRASNYLKYLYVSQSMEGFFYLDPAKLSLILSREQIHELNYLAGEPSIVFGDIDSKGFSLSLFSNEHKAYKERVSHLLAEHQMADLVYTFEDYMDESVDICEDLVIYSFNPEWPRIMDYVQELIPELETVHHEFEVQANLKELMTNLLMELDVSHQVKVHLLKNLRLIDKTYYMGMSIRVKHAIKKIVALQPEMFKYLKR